MTIEEKIAQTFMMDFRSMQDGDEQQDLQTLNEGKKSIILSVYTPYDAQLYPNADGIAIAYGYKGSQVDPKEVLAKGMIQAEEAAGPNVIAGLSVILGAFGASGKLPTAIPRFDHETKQYDYHDIIYPRGYGLTYKALSSKVIPASGVSHTGSIIVLIVCACVILAAALYFGKRNRQSHKKE